MQVGPKFLIWKRKWGLGRAVSTGKSGGRWAEPLPTVILRKKCQPCLSGVYKVGKGWWSLSGSILFCAHVSFAASWGANMAAPSKPALAGLVKVERCNLSIKVTLQNLYGIQFQKGLSYHFWDQQGSLSYLTDSGETPNQTSLPMPRQKEPSIIQASMRNPSPTGSPSYAMKRLYCPICVLSWMLNLMYLFCLFLFF